jgi:hypothetical protein
VNADGLDALDRGVIEAGQLAAQALSRVAALEAEVGQLRKWVEQATTAEQILRNAGMPEPIRAIAERKAAHSHLKVIK